MMLFRSFRPLCILALVALVCSALPTRGAAQSNDVVRIGLTASESAVPLIYAQNAGLYKKYGIDAELVQSGGTTSVAALAGGSIQLADSSTLAVITAFQKGIPFTAVSPLSFYDASNPTYALLVGSNSSIKTARDLEGKTLAVKWLEDMLGLATAAWLDARHVNVSTIHHLEIPPSATLAALQQGRVDAGVVYEPFFSDFVDSGKARALGYPMDAIARHFADTVIVGDASWVNSHQDVDARFQRALNDATAYVAAHPSDSAGILGKFAGIDPAAFAKIRRSARSDYIKATDIQPLIDAAAKYKIIPQRFPAQNLICSCALKS